ncbi:MAG: zinc carboxypeptidase [Saprospiraceae bacterium]|nr:zinc carboxypeptidase [Saprospiraceae bacterium]
MKALFCLPLLFLTWLGVIAQGTAISDYLPGLNMDPAIPLPSKILGFQVGDWHASHDQILAYARAVATVSDRVVLTPYATSHEARPLILLTISSPNNLGQLETIRLDHLARISGRTTTSGNAPVILYQGFSIHGDEASGANAAMLYLYYLAACRDPDLIAMLEKSVVLLDPCFNPDGTQRFSTWANMHQGTPHSVQSADRQHHQQWPSARTNHYWFDLNRDWLPAIHPETRGRLAIFHDWKPHILTDHHEMGSGGTFFFQPGVPSRVHPRIPLANQEMAGRIAAFHASSLDTLHTLYYTRETFDDFYFGKGSTYPDALGTIGILFEQASARGNVQETDHGLLTFPQAILHQLTTARTSLEAGVALRRDLDTYQRDFFAFNHEAARLDAVAGYQIDPGLDPYKAERLQDFFHQHRIATLVRQEEPSHIFIPLDQPGYRLIQSLFTPQKEFRDSLFYDISTWHLPSFFHVACKEVSRTAWMKLNLSVGMPHPDMTIIEVSANDLAWIIPAVNQGSHLVLSELLQAGINVSVATVPITLDSGLNLAPGSFMVLAEQPTDRLAIQDTLMHLAREHGISIYGVNRGLQPPGPDLGSPTWKKLRTPTIGLVVGGRTSAYGAGEVWHYLNTRLHLPVTHLDQSGWNNHDLDDMNTLILPQGNYTWTKTQIAYLKNWLQRGGTLILLQDALTWAKSADLVSFTARKPTDHQDTWRPYESRDADARARAVRGVSLFARLDPSHPLTYGYTTDTLSVFRLQGLYLDPLKNPYATPLRCTADPLISGYLPREDKTLVPGSAGIMAWKMGEGQIIGFTDQILFRGMTVGTQGLLDNAIFFGPILDRDSLEAAVD